MGKSTKKDKTTLIPAQYAGKWVAWSSDRTRIVASGETLQEASEQATKEGEKNPWFDKIPDTKVRFGGAAFHV